MDLRSEVGWSSVRGYLPLDLDGLARESGLLTRLRGVSSAEDLTRILLLCALPKASLRAVSDWSRGSSRSTMCWSGLFHRLRRSEAFLQACFQETLRHGAGTGRHAFAGYNLVAVDATVLCGPGATGPDQRLHTVYDLGSGIPRSIELTDRQGGERLSRHTSFGEGDLVLADRGYGNRASVLDCLKTKARLLVRFEFYSFRLLEAGTEEVLSPSQAEARIPQDGKAEISVRIPDCEIPLRALGSRNPEGKAVWLLTDLDETELPLSEARELYRARWQVELFFKRTKSILDLDELPTRDGPTARPWIWAKLVLAALASLLGSEDFSPWENRNLPLEKVPQRTLQNHPRTPARTTDQKPKTKTQKKTTTHTTRLLEA